LVRLAPSGIGTVGVPLDMRAVQTSDLAPGVGAQSPEQARPQPAPAPATKPQVPERYGPNRSGRSRHGRSVRRTYRIGVTINRSSLGGSPSRLCHSAQSDDGIGSHQIFQPVPQWLRQFPAFGCHHGTPTTRHPKTQLQAV
jgi:hypothetical protein